MINDRWQGIVKSRKLVLNTRTKSIIIKALSLAGNNWFLTSSESLES